MKHKLFNWAVLKKSNRPVNSAYDGCTAASSHNIHKVACQRAPLPWVKNFDDSSCEFRYCTHLHHTTKYGKKETCKKDQLTICKLGGVAWMLCDRKLRYVLYTYGWSLWVSMRRTGSLNYPAQQEGGFAMLRTIKYGSRSVRSTAQVICQGMTVGTGKCSCLWLLNLQHCFGARLSS